MTDGVSFLFIILVRLPKATTSSSVECQYHRPSDKCFQCSINRSFTVPDCHGSVRSLTAPSSRCLRRTLTALRLTTEAVKKNRLICYSSIPASRATWTWYEAPSRQLCCCFQTTSPVCHNPYAWRCAFTHIWHDSCIHISSFVLQTYGLYFHRSGRAVQLSPLTYCTYPPPPSPGGPLQSVFQGPVKSLVMSVAVGICVADLQ